MWFGFGGLQSRCGGIATFFPMLVSTLADCRRQGKAGRELMHSYAASCGRTGNGPAPARCHAHLFGALKVNASLALIEYHRGGVFGSPRWGWGFGSPTRSGPHEHGIVGVGSNRGGRGHRSLAYALLVRLERRAAFLASVGSWQVRCEGIVPRCVVILPQPKECSMSRTEVLS